jgi:hypothetical protein
MTLRDIQHHVLSTIATELSHETLSKTTDQVTEVDVGLLAATLWHRGCIWQIYLDALVVKLNADGRLVECQVTTSCKQDLPQLAPSKPTESIPTGNQNPSCRTQ